MPESHTDSNFPAFEASRLRLALQSRQADAAVGDIHVFDQLPSTNDEASRLARASAKERTVVFAESQSAGRGRRGNAWNSPPGRDLLFSLVLYPKNTALINHSLRLPHLIAVAICQAIDSSLPDKSSQLKWPNDVYVKGKKIAGILIENATVSGQTFFIAGIGINVNSLSSDRPAELHTTATSLREENNHPLDRHEIAAAFLSSFDHIYPQGLLDFDATLKELKKRSLLLGHEISASLEGNKITGKVVGFGDNGELLIINPQAYGEKPEALYSADQVRLV